MDKEAFLRLQYLRMVNSDDFVAERWRSSCDRFLADMWDRTPISPGARFLSPIDSKLGYSPDNVEWRFPKVRKRGHAKTAPSDSQPAPREVLKRLTKDERRANEIAAKEARLKAIADEFLRWERVRRSK